MARDDEFEGTGAAFAEPPAPVWFADAAGRRWHPVFDDRTLADLRDAIGFDVAAEVRAGRGVELCQGLYADPVRLTTVLMAACWDQYKASGLTSVEFGLALCAGGAYNRATFATVEALHRRFNRTDSPAEIRRQLNKLLRQHTKGA